MTPNASRILSHPALPTTILFLVLALTWLCYRPGLGGPFLLDDPVNIPQTELPEFSLAAIEEGILSDPLANPFFRTLSRLSFALTIHFSGLDAFSFKHQNLMLHLINGLLVFWLTSLLAVEVESKKNRNRAFWFALAVTAIWLLHPLQVSTVLYAVQRLALLSSLFLLLALISYAKGRILSRRRPVAGTALAGIGILLFGALGAASKENAALLPLYIAAIELFVFRLTFDNPKQRQLFGLLIGVTVALPILAALAYGAVLIPAFAQSYAGRDFDLPERLMTQAHVVLMYLRLFFIPIPGEMSLFHDFPITREINGATVSLALLYAALITSAMLLRQRLPLASLGITWFFVSHLMESTILPLELVFEHRNYLAILGLALILADLARNLARTPLLVRAIPAALVGLVLILGLNTSARAFAWGDLRLMLATEYERRPESLRVLTYLAEINMDAGSTNLAQRFVDELLATNPPDAGAEILNISIRCEQPRISQQIFEHARKKLETGTISGFSFESLNRLVREHVQGKCPALTFDQADALLHTAAANPRAPGGTPCLIEHIRAKFLTSKGKWAELPQAITNTIDRCGAVSDPLLRFIVGDWLSFALDVGGPDRVLATLNSLPQAQNKKLAIYIDEANFEFLHALPSDPQKLNE